MDSIWIDGIARPSFDTLKGDARCDVLIIGGGIAGILTAFMLKKAGVDCMLIEAKEICSGISKNTTAKITIQHGLIYDKIIKKYGIEKAKLYLEAQMRAMREYSELCKEISCDYEIQDSYVYSLGDTSKITDEVAALKRLGVNAKFCDRCSLPFDIAGAVRVPDQAQFHPLKFLFEIAKRLPIYENTKVLELMPGRVITNRGEIKCQKIIVATHFPIVNKHGGYFLKMYQHRSYVLALKGAELPQGMYVDESDTGLSFRHYKDLLLLGGGGHRTGKDGGNWRELQDFANKHYPQAKIVRRWAAQDCMTLDGIPYIGRYSRHTSNMLVATGFNKWGMTSAMAAAMILTELVCGWESDCASVFSPSRSILHPQLAINAAESIIGLLTPRTPRCPHLGCALKYNKAEHSWDCPCHGSRFTEDGELIDNPATDDKKNMPK